MNSLTKLRDHLTRLYSEREMLFCNGWSQQVQDRFWILSDEIPRIERVLAQADGREYAESIEIGEPITKSAKYAVFCNSESLAVLIYDGIFRNMTPIPEFVELKFAGVYAIECGGPSDELTRNHPFFWRGLADVGRYEIRNSEWKNRYLSVEQRHPQHDKGSWEKFRHFFFRFKDGDVHVLAKSVCSRVVPGALQFNYDLLRHDEVENPGGRTLFP